MNFADLKYDVIINLKNIPGPDTKRKVVVIECDDWGGIRMPSAETYHKLLEKGLPVNNSRYNQFDTLEDKDDLEQLFEILCTVKDNFGNAAVMTPFVNVANPDFKKIRENDFKQYYYERFTDTLQRYGRDARIMKMWNEGMEKRIFMPELHGREHLTVQLWMQQLRAGNKDVLTAFDHEFTSVGNVNGIADVAQEFRPEFYFTDDSQKDFLVKSLVDGVSLFKKIFGFVPIAFVPSNGIFHSDFEQPLYDTGVAFLNVFHKNAYPMDGGKIGFKNFTFKQKMKPSGLNYYIRNCAFEPTDDHYKSTDLTMKQISAAFRWNKPAIISTHRVNFMGGISKKNRDKGLKELYLLLQQIVKRWPDVEFMGSKDALTCLVKNN